MLKPLQSWIQGQFLSTTQRLIVLSDCIPTPKSYNVCIYCLSLCMEKRIIESEEKQY